MSTDSNYLHSGLTETIIGCFYTVYNKLGFGFLEKVYENALLIELREAGLSAASQIPIEVYYKDKKVGNYYADLLVNDKVIIELKAGDGVIIEEHELQLINYLRATEIEVGLLLFFGKKPQFKRKLFTNNLKNK
jgi:GxxExxY protein